MRVLVSCIADITAHARAHVSLADRLARRLEREEKKAKKKIYVCVPQWRAIDGMWVARAADGRGYHDGIGKYIVNIPAEDFGEHLYLGGDSRMTISGGYPDKIFKLPATPPEPGGGLRFELDVHPQAGLGRLAIVEGLKVRPCA